MFKEVFDMFDFFRKVVKIENFDDFKEELKESDGNGCTYSS